MTTDFIKEFEAEQKANQQHKNSFIEEFEAEYAKEHNNPSSAQNNTASSNTDNTNKTKQETLSSSTPDYTPSERLESETPIGIIKNGYNTVSNVKAMHDNVIKDVVKQTGKDVLDNVNGAVKQTGKAAFDALDNLKYKKENLKREEYKKALTKPDGSLITYDDIRTKLNSGEFTKEQAVDYIQKLGDYDKLQADRDYRDVKNKNIAKGVTEIALSALPIGVAGLGAKAAIPAYKVLRTANVAKPAAKSIAKKLATTAGLGSHAVTGAAWGGIDYGIDKLAGIEHETSLLDDLKGGAIAGAVLGGGFGALGAGAKKLAQTETGQKIINGIPKTIDNTLNALKDSGHNKAAGNIEATAAFLNNLVSSDPKAAKILGENIANRKVLNDLVSNVMKKGNDYSELPYEVIQQLQKMTPEEQEAVRQMLIKGKDVNGFRTYNPKESNLDRMRAKQQEVRGEQPIAQEPVTAEQIPQKSPLLQEIKNQSTETPKNESFNSRGTNISPEVKTPQNTPVSISQNEQKNISNINNITNDTNKQKNKYEIIFDNKKFTPEERESFNIEFNQKLKQLEAMGVNVTPQFVKKKMKQFVVAKRRFKNTGVYHDPFAEYEGIQQKLPFMQETENTFIKGTPEGWGDNRYNIFDKDNKPVGYVEYSNRTNDTVTIDYVRNTSGTSRNGIGTKLVDKVISENPNKIILWDAVASKEAENFRRTYIKNHPELEEKIMTEGNYKALLAQGKERGYNDINEYLNFLKERQNGQRSGTSGRNINREPEQGADNIGSTSGGVQSNAAQKTESGQGKRSTADVKTSTGNEKVSELKNTLENKTKKVWKSKEQKLKDVAQSLLNKVDNQGKTILNNMVAEADRVSGRKANLENVRKNWKTTADLSEAIDLSHGASPEQFANRLEKTKSKTYLAPVSGKQKKFSWTDEDKAQKMGAYGEKKLDVEEKGTVIEQYIAQHLEYKKRVNVERTLDFVKNTYAEPIVNGKIKDGYVAVHNDILYHTLKENNGKNFYKALAGGEETLSKAFKDPKEYEAWEHIYKNNSTPDYQIPKDIFDALMIDTGENYKTAAERYGTFSGASLKRMFEVPYDYVTQSFKRRVLGLSPSWVIGNRLGNYTMLGMHEKNPVKFGKHVIDAFKLDKKDLPKDLFDNNLIEANKEFMLYQSYTGFRGIDNTLNLISGRTIGTEGLTGLKKALAVTGNTVALPRKFTQNVTEAIFKFNGKFEDFERKIAWARELDKNSKALCYNVGQNMAKQKEYIKFLNDKALKEPAIRKQMVRNVQDTLGDYNTMTPFEQKVVKRIFPFYSWHRTITRHLAKAAKEDPTNFTLALLELKEIQDDDVLKKVYQRGAIPLRDLKGRIIKDKESGNPLLINPMRYINLFDTHSELFSSPLNMLNPIPKSLIEAGTGKKLFTGKPLSSPRYVFRSESTYGGTKDNYKGQRKGVYDLEKKKWLEDKNGNYAQRLPFSESWKAVPVELARDVIPELNSNLINLEKAYGAFDNYFTDDIKKYRKGQFRPYDKVYDTSFGGYNIGDKEDLVSKGSKSKLKEREEKFGTLSSPQTNLLKYFLGGLLQQQIPLSDKEKEELKKQKLSEEEKKLLINQIKWLKIRRKKSA